MLDSLDTVVQALNLWKHSEIQLTAAESLLATLADTPPPRPMLAKLEVQVEEGKTKTERLYQKAMQAMELHHAQRTGRDGVSRA